MFPTPVRDATSRFFYTLVLKTLLYLYHLFLTLSLSLEFQVRFLAVLDRPLLKLNEQYGIRPRNRYVNFDLGHVSAAVSHQDNDENNLYCFFF